MRTDPVALTALLNALLCGDLNGKGIQGGGDMCIHVTHSPCCTAEANTLL